MPRRHHPNTGDPINCYFRVLTLQHFYLLYKIFISAKYFEIIIKKYPDLKGLDLCKFKRQLDYISKNFNVISASDLAASKNNKKIAKKCLTRVI